MRDALRVLRKEGHIAYVVGGSVRDHLIGRTSKDHDIATSASPDELCKFFPEAITVGKAFGVLKIPIDPAPTVLEIATFRKDLHYSDHRHPTGIQMTGPLEDAKRRDFTMNALFYDPQAVKILDIVGGVKDIKHKVIRAIGKPKERFREDALRLLRAIRFSARLDFEIAEETWKAMLARAHLITKISAERIRDELNLMWMSAKPHRALELLSDSGLLDFILPELKKSMKEKKENQNQDWVKLLTVLRKLANLKDTIKEGPAVYWAAILRRIHLTEESETQEMAEKILEKYKIPQIEIKKILLMMMQLPKFKEVFKMRESTLQRFLRIPQFNDLLALHQAEALSHDGNLSYFDFCSERFNALVGQKDQKGYIDGKDLIALGLTPGPKFSEILEKVEDLTLEGLIRSKEQALEFVISHYGHQG